MRTSMSNPSARGSRYPASLLRQACVECGFPVRRREPREGRRARRARPIVRAPPLSGDCKTTGGGAAREETTSRCRPGAGAQAGRQGRPSSIRRAFQFRNVRVPRRCAIHVDGFASARPALRHGAWCAPCISVRAGSAIAGAVGPAIASVGRMYRIRGQENEKRPNRNVSCCKYESPTCQGIRFAVDRGDVSARLSVPSEQSGSF